MLLTSLRPSVPPSSSHDDPRPRQSLAGPPGGGDGPRPDNLRNSDSVDTRRIQAIVWSNPAVCGPLAAVRRTAPATFGETPLERPCVMKGTELAKLWNR